MGASSESRLRSVLCNQNSTLDDLKQAITAVGALLSEAQREYGYKKLRAKRAALEELEPAIENAEEEALAAAIAKAWEAEVDAVDIEKAEEKLKTLRSMTEEQRGAKAAREREQVQKKSAFSYAKKDDVMKLKELIHEVGEEVRWSDWRDPMGRTIWRCALDLRSFRVLEFLKSLGVDDRSKTNARQQTSIKILRQMQHQNLQSQQVQQQHPQHQQERGETQCEEAPANALADADESTENAPPVVTQRPEAPADTDEKRTESVLVVAECEEVPADANQHTESEPVVTGTGDQCVRSTPVPGNNENRSPSAPLVEMKSIASAKSKALRAVAQDDVVALAGITESIPVDEWSKWENKAGKSLVTLSQERGSVAAYSHLARALGLVKELKRESFEERESVWVFIRGNVQPKRATVLADTSEDAETIPIEYWDGDEPATTVDRCSVRKMFS